MASITENSVRNEGSKGVLSQGRNEFGAEFCCWGVVRRSLWKRRAILFGSEAWLFQTLVRRSISGGKESVRSQGRERGRAAVNTRISLHKERSENSLADLSTPDLAENVLSKYRGGGGGIPQSRQDLGEKIAFSWLGGGAQWKPLRLKIIKGKKN